MRNEIPRIDTQLSREVGLDPDAVLAALGKINSRMCSTLITLVVVAPIGGTRHAPNGSSDTSSVD